MLLRTTILGRPAPSLCDQPEDDDRCCWGSLLLRRRSGIQGSGSLLAPNCCCEGGRLVYGTPRGSGGLKNGRARGSGKCIPALTKDWSSVVDEPLEWESLELSSVPSLVTSLNAFVFMLGILRACAFCASIMRLSDTFSCHCSISGSGLDGNAARGSQLGKGLPSMGLEISNRLTAACKSGTCSSGPSRSCTVCHRTKPCGVRAGVEGGA